MSEGKRRLLYDSGYPVGLQPFVVWPTLEVTPNGIELRMVKVPRNELGCLTFYDDDVPAVEGDNGEKP